MKKKFLRITAALLAAVCISAYSATFFGCEWLFSGNENVTDGGNTDGGNTDGDNTDGGNTDGDSTDDGNTDGGNTDDGNTDGGNTDGGNTDGGNTDGGDTEEPQKPQMPAMPDAPIILEFSKNLSSNGDFYAANGYSNGGMFNCFWSGQSAVIADEQLYLTVSKGKDRYYGAEYRTGSRDYTFGYYGAYMKAAKCSGVVSSLFTYTGPVDGTRWDEIDIEFLGKDTTKVQFNYYVDGVGGHEYLYDLGFDASEEFHEYGFLWERDRITWYVDGEPVYMVESDNLPVTNSHIMMNVWNSIGMDDWTGPLDESALPATAQYKWVRYMAV